MDISISQGMANCNANVDLLCRVCSETVNCMNKDVYIRIDVPENHAKCHQLPQAYIGVLHLAIQILIYHIMHIGLKA